MVKTNLHLTLLLFAVACHRISLPLWCLTVFVGKGDIQLCIFFLESHRGLYWAIACWRSSWTYANKYLPTPITRSLRWERSHKSSKYIASCTSGNYKTVGLYCEQVQMETRPKNIWLELRPRLIEVFVKKKKKKEKKKKQGKRREWTCWVISRSQCPELW